ncbi:hypothetical protein PG988_003497 [Apiospora saccharicola]
MDAAAQAEAAAQAMAAIMYAIHAAITEIWTLYTVGTCLITARLFVRIKLVGFRGLQPDDFLVMFAWVCYTSVSVVGHVFILDAGGKHTSQLTQEARLALPQSEYGAYEYGSKLFLVGETLYLGTVWTLKMCMAFFYRRLVRGLWAEKLILPLMGGIGATFIAGMLTIYTTCVPVSRHWQILPNPGRALQSPFSNGLAHIVHPANIPMTTTALCVPQNPWVFVTIMSLNLLTDTCILSLPIPVLAKMRTNAVRKVGLVFLFSLGAFTMVAAILRIISIFVLNQESAGALWSIREDFIAVVVTQAPMRGPHGESHELTFGSATMNRVKRPKDPYSLTQLGITQAGGSESQEEMINPPTSQTNQTHQTNPSGTRSPPRKLSFSRKGGSIRSPTMEKYPHHDKDGVVVVSQTVSSQVSVCTEEQKRRDIEAWRKQPWEA